MKIIRMIKQAFMYLWNLLFSRGKANFDVYSIGSSDVRALLKLAMPEVEVTLLDGEYAFTTLKGWRGIIDDMMDEMSPYKKNVHDCDDFAVYMAGHVSNDYGLNGCLTAIGSDAGGGGHAFNVILYQEGRVKWKVLEPQSGEFAGNYTIRSIRG